MAHPRGSLRGYPRAYVYVTPRDLPHEKQHVYPREQLAVDVGEDECEPTGDARCGRPLAGPLVECLAEGLEVGERERPAESRERQGARVYDGGSRPELA